MKKYLLPVLMLSAAFIIYKIADQHYSKKTEQKIEEKIDSLLIVYNRLDNSRRNLADYVDEKYNDEFIPKAQFDSGHALYILYNDSLNQILATLYNLETNNESHKTAADYK